MSGGRKLVTQNLNIAVRCGAGWLPHDRKNLRFCHAKTQAVRLRCSRAAHQCYKDNQQGRKWQFHVWSMADHKNIGTWVIGRVGRAALLRRQVRLTSRSALPLQFVPMLIETAITFQATADSRREPRQRNGQRQRRLSPATRHHGHTHKIETNLITIKYKMPSPTIAPTTLSKIVQLFQPRFRQTRPRKSKQAPSSIKTPAKSATAP